MRVVCVDASGELGELINKGEVYTVITKRDMPYASNRNYPHKTYILREVKNPSPGWGDIGFYVGRFRPLNESRLDQFRAHLKAVPKRVEERV